MKFMHDNLISSRKIDLDICPDGASATATSSGIAVKVTVTSCSCHRRMSLQIPCKHILAYLQESHMHQD